VNKAELTYDLSLLDQSAATWRKSSGLRLVYRSLYEEVARNCAGERLLELGAGIGASREFLPNVMTTDLQKTKYVDHAMSAYAIEAPEAGEAWDAIFAIDLLHHLREPFSFFTSAADNLKPGGRIVLIEPAATAYGRLFYRSFHHEPIVVEAVQPPFVFEPNGENGEFANMGMGVGLFEKERVVTTSLLAQLGLSVSYLAYRDVMAYPLSGGYSKPQLLPTGVLQFFLRVESSMPQCLMRWLGLRMIVVIEKK
jgi:SAM-dependent methyltransferase